MEKILTQGLTALSLPTDSVPALMQYARLLLEKNRSMNLTAITEPSQVARLHMLDSAALLGAADLRGKRVLDVGTGGGFPGLVLKLVEPSIQLTLLDSLAKRMNWLEEIAPALGVSDVTFLTGRAEELGRAPELREHFDYVVSRAVADLPVLCELCLPFVKVGGQFLAMKGANAGSERERAANGVKLLGGRLMENYSYALPGTEILRQVIRVEKIAPTGDQWPRRFHQIKRHPL